MRTELHRHLDVSLRLSTLLELAQERGLEAKSTSLEMFRRKIVLTQPLGDLSSVLATFALFQRVLDRPEVLERVAFEALEDIRAEGTSAVELRFSPSFVCEHSKLGWDDALRGFEAGMLRALDEYPEMRAGLICIASRDYGPEAVAKTAEFTMRNAGRFIAMDLAGPETRFPCRLFEEALRPVRGSGYPITIHAGEDSGPENIWEAIELLGARRIGHGISAIRDSALMEYLGRNSICLEVCPTSNWITQAVPSLEKHPLPQLLRAGVPVSINTDDPSVFGSGLDREVEICKKIMGMSEAEIDHCFSHARGASFLKF